MSNDKKQPKRLPGKLTPGQSRARKLGLSRLGRLHNKILREHMHDPSKPITIDELDRERLLELGLKLPDTPKPKPPTDPLDRLDFIQPETLPAPVALGQERIAAYVRVSTKDQSVSMQVKAINDYCRLRGWPEPHIYADNATGVQIARKSLQDLLRHVTEKRYTMIVCWKLDRIARSMLDLLNIIKLVHAHNCTFVSMTENLDFSTPAGRLMYQMLGAFAEFEAAIISERIMAGQDFARSRGKLFGTQWKNIDPALLLEFRQNGLYFHEIGTLLGVSEKTVIEHYKRIVMPKFYPGSNPDDYETVGLGEYRPFGWAFAAGISAEQVEAWRSDPSYRCAEDIEQRRREIRAAGNVAYDRIMARTDEQRANAERKRARKEASGYVTDWRRDRRELREALAKQGPVESGSDALGVSDGGAGGSGGEAPRPPQF
jgi:DNA invertase Pin-like site-specific DNA recombinase